MLRITAGYLAVAWVLWQVVDTTCPTFECSLSFQKSIFWFLVAGLPVTLAIAWVNWRTAIVAGIGILAGATVMFFVMRGPAIDSETAAVIPPAETAQPAPTPAEVVEEKSIAVLPFVNMSADPEQEYFSDGISEEILNALVGVPDLRVAARTSSFYFKGKDVQLVEIGETLKVNHVLEGSVRKAGNRLRITAQLIKVEDGFHLWSETYDRELTDIFAIQDEIAQSVVKELEVALGLSDEEPLVKSGTSNTEAYNWYLRGRYYLERQSPEDFQKAVESFAKAVSIDPNFAGGHGGLAYSLTYLSIYQGSDISTISERSKTSSALALEIVPNQPEALMAQAFELAVSHYDFQSAETLLKKALSVSPNKTLVVDFYSFFLLQPQRRFDEALALLQEAERVVPLSSLVKEGIAAMLMWQGRYAEASVKFGETLALNPADVTALLYSPITQARLERFDEADASLRRFAEFVGETDMALYARAWVHIAKGEDVEAEQTRQRQIAHYNSGVLGAAQRIGDVTARLGLIDEAVDWFERAAEAGTVFKLWIPAHSTDIPELWNHPRFQALLKRMNLDDASIAALLAAEATE